MKLIKKILCISGVCIALYACKKNTPVINDPVIGFVKDIEGNMYRTLKIGDQEWTIDNYRCTQYNNGNTISHLDNSDDWKDTTKAKLGAYCFYGKTTNQDTIKRYGALYNWYTVNKPEFPPQGGWRIPTKEDFNRLANTIKATFKVPDNSIGQSLKSPDYWMNDINTTDLNRNCIGFTALPGGFCDYGGGFYSIGEIGQFWYSTGFALLRTQLWPLEYYNLPHYLFKITGMSVRFVRG